jgi:hypothetical protein
MSTGDGSKSVIRKLGASAGLLAVAVVLGGCVKVAPYERGMLAHPTMTLDDVAVGIDDHVRVRRCGRGLGWRRGRLRLQLSAAWFCVVPFPRHRCVSVPPEIV